MLKWRCWCFYIKFFFFFKREKSFNFFLDWRTVKKTVFNLNAFFLYFNSFSLCALKIAFLSSSLHWDGNVFLVSLKNVDTLNRLPMMNKKTNKCQYRKNTWIDMLRIRKDIYFEKVRRRKRLLHLLLISFVFF